MSSYYAQGILYQSLRRGWWALKNYPAHRIASLLNQSQWWPRRRLENFRHEKLVRLIDHCYHHVPYYRCTMDEYRLRPNDICQAADLSKLPVLTKDIVRANWKELRADNIPDSDTFVVATGGSTGEPMRIAKSYETEAWATMCFERGTSWGGLMPGMQYIALKGGSLGDSEKSWWRKMTSRFSGRIDLLAYELRRDTLPKYIDVICRSRAQFITGYASCLCYLARMLLERDEKLNLTAAFTTSESLLPSWADTIRQAMNCKVYDYYGCGESNSLGFQCQEGNTYHIPEEHVILEVESEDGQTDLLGKGGVLITDLDNYAMPLLRYRNGDYLTVGDKACSCGRSLRLISKLEGRTSGFLLSATGELVSGGICDFIMSNVTIEEFQVRQVSLNHVLVLIVVRDRLTQKDEDHIRTSFSHYLGDQVKIDIQLVESISRTRSQKLQTAVNELL